MVAATGANYGESNGVRVRLWWVKSTQSQTLTDAFFCKLNRYCAFPRCPYGDVRVCSIDSHVQLISMNGIQDGGRGGVRNRLALSDCSRMEIIDPREREPKADHSEAE